MQQVYLNPMQRDVLAVDARVTVVCAGRGTGKSLLHAAVLLRGFQHMPRSTTAIVGATAKGVLTNTLPSMLDHWERWGYREGVHYVVGRRPPKEWPRPLYPPQRWDNFLCFYNGALGHIISQDRKGTSNSKSFDFVAVDEAKFVNFDRLKSETIPANRGQQRQFGHLHFHHGMLITSDMPLTKRGSWFLTYEQQCDPERVSDIRRYAAHIEAVRREGADTPWRRAKIARMEQTLCAMRRGCTFFGRYSSLCNIEVLGREWFAQMRRDLPPAEFRTSILCEPVRFMRDGFYSSLTDENLYRATDFHRLDALGYDRTALRRAREDCRLDGDLVASKPLCLAFDYNSNINCLVVGQVDEDGRRLNVVKSFYVKYDRKLPELCADFCQYYRFHPTREAILYYDTTALSSNYAVNNEDFLFVITRALERGGFQVRPVFIGNPMRHVEKHLLINGCLAGRRRLRPMFNEENNQALLASMREAGVWNGGKDKRGEKLRETEESPLEERTDFSDAFDTLCIGCERFPQGTLLPGVTSDFG